MCVPCSSNEQSVGPSAVVMGGASVALDASLASMLDCWSSDDEDNDPPPPDSARLVQPLARPTRSSTIRVPIACVPAAAKKTLADLSACGRGTLLSLQLQLLQLLCDADTDSAHADILTVKGPLPSMNACPGDESYELHSSMNTRLQTCPCPQRSK